MSSLYRLHIENNENDIRVYASFSDPSLGEQCVEIDFDLYEVLQDLQRELWRIERRESRHSVHLENIPDCYIPHEEHVSSPEQILMKKLESDEIWSAFHQIPLLQQRRFLMRYVLDYPIKQIAQYESCSERAVKYSLALAKRNLQEILNEKAER